MAQEIPFDPAVIPKPGDQHDADVRGKQAKFQAAFGDFKSRHVTGFWLGPAPQGEWVGAIFYLEEGTEVRVAMAIVALCENAAQNLPDSDDAEALGLNISTSLYVAYSLMAKVHNSLEGCEGMKGGDDDG